MVRQFGKSSDYLPVRKFNDTRYRIGFDFVASEDAEYGTWSLHDYFGHPTTEQVQKDVKDMTIQRYINDGLTPPAREDIDVSEYIIPDGPTPTDELTDSEALNIITGR